MMQTAVPAPFLNSAAMDKKPSTTAQFPATLEPQVNLVIDLLDGWSLAHARGSLSRA
jgi:hypothetical protein